MYVKNKQGIANYENGIIQGYTLQCYINDLFQQIEEANETRQREQRFADNLIIFST